MAVTDFEQWYNRREIDSKGCLTFHSTTPEADAMWGKWLDYKREMDARVAGYDKLISLVDAEVISKKPDLPNISSGETAGMIRRMARNLVQHTPNVEVISEHDDESMKGVYSRFILASKIIGDDQYSNDMQQNLFASAKNALTLGFDAVVPVLLQDAANGWYIKYDNIYYRDVFPEPGAKDIRSATDVFVRRYLTKGEVKLLIQTNAAGWDISALWKLLKTDPSNRQQESVDKQSQKHRTIPKGYEIITWYSSTGEPFLTIDARDKTLLRIEENRHPLKWHPVFFLVMEKDLNQPLGKSQVELVLGRQEFQDLMLNGAMKLWYRNINPPIIGYGTVNAAPNLGPGKYTEIKNPNARLEAFEVNTQTLMQYNSIVQGNQASMVQMVGAADQQMASQTTGGMMSQTAPGVEAQQQMVDITTNNYQKAIESFFSRYCSYALTIYFQELKGEHKVKPTADARNRLLGAGLDPKEFNEKGELEVSYTELATEYWVRTIPGSLVELEDEKQVRMLNEMFVPLSQAMPALAATQDQELLRKMAATMEFIVQKQIQLSGSNHGKTLETLWKGGNPEQAQQSDERTQALDALVSGFGSHDEQMSTLTAIVQQQQEQIGLIGQGIGALMDRLGMSNGQSANNPAAVEQ